jgi:hypothetical protein
MIPKNIVHDEIPEIYFRQFQTGEFTQICFKQPTFLLQYVCKEKAKAQYNIEKMKPYIIITKVYKNGHSQGPVCIH